MREKGRYRWKWWHITLAYLLCYPSTRTAIHWILDRDFDSTEFIVWLATSALIGLIVGGLYEFAKREKAAHDETKNRKTE